MERVKVQTGIQLESILFATDFSSAANVAIPYAIALVKRFGAKLHLLHVRPPVINPLTEPASWYALEEAAKMEAEQQKQALLTRFREVQPEILIEEGDLWSNVAAEIEKCNIDLIVIGTRGRSGIRKLLLGSAAEEIFRRSSCPVLTVGPHSVEANSFGEFTNILFATDFQPESMAAATYVLSLAKECQAFLTLLHVIEEAKTGELVHTSELTESSMRLLRALAPDDEESLCVPQYVVEMGSVAEKILEVATRRGADLIVLGIRRPDSSPVAATHLGFATAHRVVSQAKCPVLTVRT